MSLVSQQIIVALFVLACLAHLAWRGWQTLRGGKTGCGSCGSCPKPGPQSATPMVSLDSVRESAHQK